MTSPRVASTYTVAWNGSPKISFDAIIKKLVSLVLSSEALEKENQSESWVNRSSDQSDFTDKLTSLFSQSVST